jgi:hypothetical protein
MVYFIINKEDNIVKIGYSANPKRRLSSLINEHKKPLEIYNVIDGDMNVEKYFHNKHKNYHVKGEWFNADLLILNDYDICYDEDLINESEKKVKEIKKLRGVYLKKSRPIYMGKSFYEKQLQKAESLGMSFSSYVCFVLRGE